MGAVLSSRRGRGPPPSPHAVDHPPVPVLGGQGSYPPSTCSWGNFDLFPGEAAAGPGVRPAPGCPSCWSSTSWAWSSAGIRRADCGTVRGADRIGTGRPGACPGRPGACGAVGRAEGPGRPEARRHRVGAGAGAGRDVSPGGRGAGQQRDGGSVPGRAGQEAKVKQSRIGAEVLADVLARAGVDTIFGLPGSTEAALLETLRDRKEANGAGGLRYVLGLHEGAVVSMADGYARVTGGPGVVGLHTSVGTLNGASQIYNCYRDGS